MRKWSALACLALWGCAADPAVRSRAENVVTASLRATDPGERLQATWIAARDPALKDALPPRLEDADAQVRAVAAVALRARPVLEALLRGQDAPARAIAVEGVAALADATTWLTTLAADANPSVRARVAAFLRDQGLIGRLAADSDPGVRAAAVGAMRERGMLSLIEAALADTALGVRLAALSSLVRLDPTPVRLAALGAGTDRFLALRAAVQLRKLGDTARAVEAVRTAAADPHGPVRVAAMNAAGELGEDGAALARPALADPSHEVRLAAARALIATGHPDEARPVLAAALPDLDAAEELARLGDPRGVAPLEAAVHSKSPELRRRALPRYALTPSSRAGLVQALDDGDAGVRLTAAEILIRRAVR
jgi:HEAT repeat protein